MLDESEFDVIGEASSGKNAVEIVRKLHPDIVLLDIRMAGGDGLDALMVIKAESPKSAVIMLTTYDNPTYMARAVAGGASGYLLKGIGLDELVSSLRAVAAGDVLLRAEDLVRSLREVQPGSDILQDLIEPLTNREVEVLRLLATGIPNREIGSILFIAESTVKTHVEHIIAKLGVSDRVQAAVWAARTGIASAG